MLDSGVVDENVESTGRLQGVFDHLADGLRLRHIGRRVGRADLEVGGDLRLRLRDVVGLAEPIEDDVGAGGGERPRDAEPDTAGRARHQR
jgi:hypothetical protein